MRKTISLKGAGFSEGCVSATVGKIGEYVVPTPVRRLPWLEQFIGHPVYLKLESQQITGSFKYRGAVAKALAYGQETTLIAASAGNHGLAVAEACRVLAKKANICVPVSASPVKKERIIAAGAGLIEYGYTLEEATEHAIHLAERNGWIYVSPYNDVSLIIGQATAWDEFLREVPSLNHVIVPIGGGGLISGAVLAAQELGRDDLSVFGCEPANYASMKRSVEQDRITEVLRRPTFADGLATNIEADSITFGIVRKNVDEIISLSEEDIAVGVLSLLNRESLLVEGAGALSVMACLRLKERGLIRGPVGFIATGGNIHHTTLSRILSYPVQDKLCLRLLERRGRLEEETAVIRVHEETEKKEETEGQETTGGSLRNDLLCLLAGAKNRSYSVRKCLDDYKQYCKEEGLVVSHDAVVLVRDLLSAAGETLAKTESLLSNASNADMTHLIEAEAALRASIQTVAASYGALNWRSPVYAQSMVPQFFLLGSQDSGDVNYERYGHNEARRIERQMLEILGLSRDRFACTVVSSGMAAYTLVEGYLIRHVLERDDIALTAPYIYFEGEEQLKNLDTWIRVIEAKDYSVDTLADMNKVYKPKVIFADQLANNLEQRMLDINVLLNMCRNNPSRNIPAFVIDGTMVPDAASNVLNGLSSVENIFYIESCSKYLQFGFDMSMAGIVIHDVKVKPYLDRLRRNMGLIPTEYGSMLFPEYDQATFKSRVLRLERNASEIAEGMSRNPEVRALFKVIHPSLADHPDNELARAKGRYGACVTFKFQSIPEDNKDQLEAFIDVLLSEARIRRIPLTKGVSFGFSFCRISAASSIAENDPPFLRLAVGGHASSHNTAITQTFSAACRRFAETQKVRE